MSEPTLPPEGAALDEAAVEALLRGSSGRADPVADVLDALRAEGGRFTPEPSAALLELFATGLAGDEFTRRRTRSRKVVAMLLAGGTTLGLSGVAAAHDALPAPAQSVVTDIVNGLTPFHITGEDRRKVPAPADPAPHRRTVEPSDDGGRAADLTPTRSGRSGPDSGSGRGSGSGGSGSGGSGSGGSGSGGSGSGGSGSSGSGSSGSGSSGSGSGGSDSTGGSGSGGSGSDGSGSGGGSGGSGQTSGSAGSGSGRDGGSGGGSGSGGSDDSGSSGSSGGGSDSGGSR